MASESSPSASASASAYASASASPRDPHSPIEIEVDGFPDPYSGKMEMNLARLSKLLIQAHLFSSPATMKSESGIRGEILDVGWRMTSTGKPVSVIVQANEAVVSYVDDSPNGELISYSLKWSSEYARWKIEGMDAKDGVMKDLCHPSIFNREDRAAIGGWTLTPMKTRREKVMVTNMPSFAKDLPVAVWTRELISNIRSFQNICSGRSNIGLRSTPLFHVAFFCKCSHPSGDLSNPPTLYCGILRDPNLTFVSSDMSNPIALARCLNQVIAFADGKLSGGQ